RRHRRRGEDLGARRRRADGRGFPAPARELAVLPAGRPRGDEPGGPGRRQAQEVRDQWRDRLHGRWPARGHGGVGRHAWQGPGSGTMILGVLDDLLDRPAGQKLGLLAGVVIAVAVLDWQYWYGPQARALTAAQSRVTERRLELEGKRAKANVRAEAERQLRDLTAELRRAQARLPDQREIADLLSSIAASGRSGLRPERGRRRGPGSYPRPSPHRRPNRLGPSSRTTTRPTTPRGGVTRSNRPARSRPRFRERPARPSSATRSDSSGWWPSSTRHASRAPSSRTTTGSATS